MQNQQELTNQINKFTTQKTTLESELNTLGTNRAIAENNLKSIQDQAQQMFGTSDVNQLGAMLTDLNNEHTALENELNQLNMEG